MYDHSDTSNAYLLGQGWSPLTFAELNGAYKYDFMDYFNNNNGLISLLTWSSSNCCFSFGELVDQYLTLITNGHGNDTSYCAVFPAFSMSSECNPAGGYPAGTKYIWYNYAGCHNGEYYVDELDVANVAFGLTNLCSQANNPGIWKRCGNSTITTTTDYPSTMATTGKFHLYSYITV